MGLRESTVAQTTYMLELRGAFSKTPVIADYAEIASHLDR